MPDPVLFVLGVLVTAVVGLAVWTVGVVDFKDRPRPASERSEPREEPHR